MRYARNPHFSPMTSFISDINRVTTGLSPSVRPISFITHFQWHAHISERLIRQLQEHGIPPHRSRRFRPPFQQRKQNKTTQRDCKLSPVCRTLLISDTGFRPARNILRIPPRGAPFKPFSTARSPTTDIVGFEFRHETHRNSAIHYS